MQTRSIRGSGEPAWVSASLNACLRLGPDPRRALGPAAHPPHQQAGHVTAPDQCCSYVRKFLPRRRPHVTQSGLRTPSLGNPCGSLGLIAHYVATPPDRLDVILAARCASEFFSQLADKDVDDLHLWLIHPAVEIAQEHFLAQRRSLAQRQEF